MSGDKVARVLAGLAVLAVAVVAGWVSFGHIAVLAAAHGYSRATAHMLPVSVDGLILASSMALLTGSAPWLSRAGLVLGILATLAANAAAGAEFGIVGALVNVWPGVAFVVASEILLRMIRATREVPSAEEAEETVAADAPIPVAQKEEAVSDDADAEEDKEFSSGEDTDADAVPDITPAPRRTRGGQTTADKVAALRARHPDMTQAQMAARLKVSERTVRRHLATAA